MVLKPSNVANLLKQVVNAVPTEDGIPMYEDIGDMPNLLELSIAIKILEKAEDSTILEEEKTNE